MEMSIYYIKEDLTLSISAFVMDNLAYNIPYVSLSLIIGDTFSDLLLTVLI